MHQCVSTIGVDIVPALTNVIRGKVNNALGTGHWQRKLLDIGMVFPQAR